jgi:hypothetical protein
MLDVKLGLTYPSILENKMAEESEKTSLTTAKTLWTETILEILYQTLKAKKSDEELRSVLKEVRAKGFKPGAIVSKVEKKVDKQAALRVKALLQKSE